MAKKDLNKKLSEIINEDCNALISNSKDRSLTVEEYFEKHLKQTA